jgi:hypothetical protein
MKQRRVPAEMLDVRWGFFHRAWPSGLLTLFFFVLS